MQWRLGLDLGTNSIGWTILATDDPQSRSLDRWRLIDGGVRIFPDSREPAKGGRVGDALAVERRMARGMRRTRDRRLNRMAYLMRELKRLDLMPTDTEACKALEALDPYELRAAALERPLSPHELGRTLFHLAKRRGFKSNRKAGDSDDGLRAEQITELKAELKGRTLGQFLWDRKAGGHSIRFRGREPWFPDRQMYADEFDRIHAVQAPHHNLTPDDWQALRDNSVLFQHPLKPVERGWCGLLPGERRTHRDTPIAQWFRLYEELNNLRWIDNAQQAHALSLEQRQAILDLLLTRASEVKFTAMRSKLKGADGKPQFPRDSRFNLEDDRRKGLDPHRVAVRMRSEPALADLWEAMRDDPALDDLFELLHAAQDDDSLQIRLREDFDLTEGQARALARLPLTPTTTRLSRKAMEHLVPIMRDQGLGYAEAVAEMGNNLGIDLHHSHRPLAGDLERLPYYGDLLTGAVVGGDLSKDAEHDPEGHYGRIANPTVHVALNQLRKLVNRLIDRMGGNPAEIHVELSRDLKLSNKKRNEVNSEIAKNTRNNERLRERWREISGGREANARDLKKLKLWDELGKDELARRCVFTGKTIAGHHLVNGEVDIEHLLPFSRTLDDTNANLTLSFKWANRLKGNLSPHEAFGANQHAGDGVVWAELLDRASRMPKSKRWRFSEDAMEKWEADSSFIARQLTDNAYISRLARRYLGGICDRVMPAPGKLTALVRGKWHLNSLLADDNRKNREDHRHHMIDAFTVALTDYGLLQRVSALSKRGADDRLHIAVPDLPEKLRRDFSARLEEVIVSYKPDHGHQGRMFNDTAYGIVSDIGVDPTLPKHKLVVRKPLVSLSPNELDAIRDKAWRERVQAFLYGAGWHDLGKSDQAKKLPELMASFSERHGIGKLRILVANQSAQRIESAPYKAYAPDSFVCCDVWKMPAGKPTAWKAGEFKGVGHFWSYAESANGVPDAISGRPHPAAKHVCRLFKDDIVAFDEGGGRQIMRVAGFSTTNNKLDLRPLTQTSGKQNYISINVLMQSNIRKVHILPDGVLRDPKAA